MPVLTRITDQAADQAARAEFWKSWFCRHLPTELAARVSDVVEREDTLTVFAASAVWSARLRYALRELEPQIRSAAPALNALSVRVRP